jgi:hypothetical protein
MDRPSFSSRDFARSFFLLRLGSTLFCLMVVAKSIFRQYCSSFSSIYIRYLFFFLSTMSDPSSSIPVMRHPANQMETGPNGNNLAAAAASNHPIDNLQRNSSAAVERGFLDLDGVRRLYGSGLAMRLATERQLASQVGGRLPGMEQSNLVMDTVTGNDVMLDFSDILGRPEHAPVASVRDPHTAMQRKLGL